jgi:hypothetical protein
VAAVKSVKFVFLQWRKEVFCTMYKVALADQSHRRQSHVGRNIQCSCCYP